MKPEGTLSEIVAGRGGLRSLGAWACVLLLGPVTIGCTDNLPYRTTDLTACEPDHCDLATLIEHYPSYDLAFVEFTERGNLFDRNKMQQVLEFVGKQARYDPDRPDQGVLTVVFVHGWKHNARADDENVRSFRELLAKVAPLSTRRRVVGVYVGWRGLSIDAGPLTNITYWERKATAEQVAKGGVTELLLRLEREVIDDDPARPNRNLYFVTGHSFGGAVVLAALNEILLERVVNAAPLEEGGPCVQTRPFGHGVVLLNPAIEANEALQLKELVAETCFGPQQIRLMHVISSDADEATNKSFRLGQWFGVTLTWRQATLEREFDGKQLQVEESDLDTITVGNFKPFQTGQLERSDSTDTPWRYRSCIGEEAACLDPADRDHHIPVEHNEPLAFIHTDGSFIADHNDVFNDNVSAYLAAVMAEARYKLALGAGLQDSGLPPQCGSDEFGPCFAYYQARFEALAQEGTQ